MKRNRIVFLLLMVLIFNLIMVGCDEETGYIGEDYEGELVVHFIDVGQGDSTFICFPNGKTAIIDGGTRKSGEKVVNYLKELGINKIDYLIATHPHEDHIGGLPQIVKNFTIGKVYMPDRTASTKIFEELLNEIKNKDLKIEVGKGGDYIIDESTMKFFILAPNRDDYNETNDFSIVTKIEYMDNSFIIMGDAEESSEQDILKKGYDLKANVLRIGHHGGRTSSTSEFLNEVKPDYFVISLGKDNSYGHPHKETIERIKKTNSNILRTDELGDIVIVSDGKNLRISKDIIKEDKIEGVFIGNKNTKVYHKKGCGTLPKEENQIIFKSREEAESEGYRPHDKCIK